VLITEEGRALLDDRFSPGFDDRRKERAAKFNGKKNQDQQDEDSIVDEEMPPPAPEEEDLDDHPAANVRRMNIFAPTRINIGYVCRQIRRHDLCFLLTDVFPDLPDRHIFQCLKIIWKATYRLTDDPTKTTVLPKDMLNLPLFRETPNQDGNRPGAVA
jgi:hypothetical protein